MIQAIINNNNDSSLNDPLKLAVKQFEAWRAIKTTQRQPIPKQLWALVDSLISQYGFTKTVSALNLRTTDVKKHFDRTVAIKPLPVLTKKTMQFIDCSQQLCPTNPFVTQSCSIEFTLKNATVVKFSGLNSAEIQNVITLLMGHP